jgi:hypothetical protein
VEGDARDVTSVSVKGEDWVGVLGCAVIETDVAVPGRSKEMLIWRNSQPVNLLLST